MGFLFILRQNCRYLDVFHANRTEIVTALNFILKTPLTNHLSIPQKIQIRIPKIL